MRIAMCERSLGTKNVRNFNLEISITYNLDKKYRYA